MDWKNYVPNLNLYNLWHKSHRILAEGLAQLNKTRKVYFSTQIPIARLILATRNLHNAIHLHLYIGQHAPSSICGINGSKAPGETKLHVLCISNGDSHLLGAIKNLHLWLLRVMMETTTTAYLSHCLSFAKRTKNKRKLISDISLCKLLFSTIEVRFKWQSMRSWAAVHSGIERSPWDLKANKLNWLE